VNTNDLGYAEAAKLFIPSGEFKCPLAADQLNNAGNRIVAEINHGRFKNGLFFTK